MLALNVLYKFNSLKINSICYTLICLCRPNAQGNCVASNLDHSPINLSYYDVMGGPVERVSEIHQRICHSVTSFHDN